MSNIWIASDWHLFHGNVLKFKDDEGNLTRPGFINVNHMNEYILEMHNEVVKPGDVFYNLGDVVFGNKQSFEKFFPKFNGIKRLIVGNHDDIKYLSKGSFFQKILMWRMLPEFNVMLSHVPFHESALYRRQETQLINVHGHIHENLPPKGNYVNVSVEMIGYRPVHIEDIASLHKAQQGEIR